MLNMSSELKKVLKNGVWR